PNPIANDNVSRKYAYPNRQLRRGAVGLTAAAAATFLVAVAISGPTSAAEQSARVLGQSGSGERGQSGSGERGQSGSGERGQSGSGERGQSGSGERGQSGSGERGQSGSGERGQSGSSGRAISVADVFGQSGSGSRGALGVVEQVTGSAKA